MRLLHSDASPINCRKAHQFQDIIRCRSGLLAAVESRRCDCGTAMWPMRLFGAGAAIRPAVVGPLLQMAELIRSRTPQSDICLNSTIFSGEVTMKRFLAITVLSVLSIGITYALASTGSKVSAKSACGCVDCQCPDCNGICSCDECACGVCGCVKAATIATPKSSKSCCQVVAKTASLSRCHCTGCTGESCSCDNCECEVCACGSTVSPAKSGGISSQTASAKCGCGTCACPNCDGETCSCEVCTCDGCACSK